MEKPVRRSLLPGVTDGGTGPSVIFHSRSVIVRARRRAVIRDVVDLLLLICVDGLFLRWPGSHIPALGRYDSLVVLAMINAAMIATLWLARAMPRWSARRVASTWSAAERSRLFSRL